MPHAAVVGLGRSGIAAARLLNKQGWIVELGDRASSENLQTLAASLQPEGITVKLGYSLSLDSPHPPDLIVVSPGVPWDLPVFVEARQRGIDTIGEMELAWRNLHHCPWVGITGTNGKTTTTALIAAIFQAGNLKAPSCGNIGYAACELALSDETYDWVIAEISSYQIESSQKLAPQIGLWTTFTPDHLNRHYTLDNYYQIKASLLQRSQCQIFNGDDPYLRNLGLKAWPDAIWTTVQGKDHLLTSEERSVYLQDDWIFALGQKIAPIHELKMFGEHNKQNVLMAVGAACVAGIDPDAIAHTLATFSGVPHRLESICTYQGIHFINDSKATNYDAAEVGLNAMPAPVILIAGGEPKQGDDTAWLVSIHEKAAAVLLIGEAAPQFAQRLKAVGYNNYEQVGTMEKAVSRSVELAQSHNVATVLLSPACASFDQYQSFEHRGDHFRQLCLNF
ncbi:UDP-N-acetylmuramoyl-L-alanine--D-glutamate ligase [Spirulina subsalsa FACHB-351]|uniref:UDP-N-acetylmuramoylalanine--D-glutamate ligase n=1 Tax=Spirulina subsalsa FACHB-351 TaxID=234711 RepID=A0ABT3LAA9_9CYAN|nr:UDP-N-acetylmuramoyl-L-alanine--D-glutamate ligase [Spirulina subsalsa]MCW6038441.1 UDP-N-acetylmuramoyl-L-alanine--D-glutamate ligase [Spirulina subsalsa FACHB-351]